MKIEFTYKITLLKWLKEAILFCIAFISIWFFFEILKFISDGGFGYLPEHFDEASLNWHEDKMRLIIPCLAIIPFVLGLILNQRKVLGHFDFLNMCIVLNKEKSNCDNQIKLSQIKSIDITEINNEYRSNQFRVNVFTPKGKMKFTLLHLEDVEELYSKLIEIDYLGSKINYYPLEIY